MKKVILTISALMISAMISTGAFATVPDLIPVQGVLADSADLPIDALTDITFNLYDVETGGTALWTDTFVDVDVVEGFFTVYLGSGTALDFASLISNSEVWMGITVETDPEMDRFQLATVPFAIEAQVSQSVGSLTEANINSNFLSSSSPAAGVTATQVSNWNTAYGWGDHAGLYAPISHTHAWGTITGIPAGFADGVDNDTNTTYTAGTGLNLAGTTFSVDPTDFNSTNPINQYYTTGTISKTGTGYLSVGSVSFTPPVSGHVLITGMSEVYCSTGCSTGSTQTTYLYVSTSTTTPNGSYSRIGWNTSDGTGSINLKHLSTQYEWAVTGGTAYTFYALARLGTSTSTYVYLRRNLSYVFIPD